MPVVTIVLKKVVREMLDDDYLKHLLVHHHLGNIQNLNNNLHEYFFCIYSHQLQHLFSSLIMISSLVKYLVTLSFTLCTSLSCTFLYTITLATSNNLYEYFCLYSLQLQLVFLL